MNKAMGAHSVRTGVEWRQYREKSIFSANDQTGQFNFGDDVDARPARQLRRCPLARPVVRRVPARSAREQQLRQPRRRLRRAVGDDGIFLQDDWRIGSRLTLNLGVRYEFEMPLLEAAIAASRGFDAAASQAFSWSWTRPPTWSAASMRRPGSPSPPASCRRRRPAQSPASTTSTMTLGRDHPPHPPAGRGAHRPGRAAAPRGHLRADRHPRGRLPVPHRPRVPSMIACSATSAWPSSAASSATRRRCSSRSSSR